MKTSKVISAKSQACFWRVLKKCLLEFHEASPTLLGKARQLRRRIEEAPIEEIKLFFHAEPFHVACDLAHHQLDVKDYLERYLEIRDGCDSHQP
jgi:hypothetical protein